MKTVAFGELQVTGCICLRQVASYFSSVVDCTPAPPLFIEEVSAKLTEEFLSQYPKSKITELTSKP